MKVTPKGHEEIIADPRKVKDFSEIESRWNALVAGFNASADHTIDALMEDGVRLSPDEAYIRWHGARRLPADDESFDLLLQMWHPPVPVTSAGIRICIKGQSIRYGRFERALSRFKSISKSNRGLVHCSFDPDHIESVRVYDSDLVFVCIAQMDRLGGQSGAIAQAHVKTLIRDKAEYKKSLAHVAKHSLTQQLSPAERLAEIAFRQGQAELTELAASSMPIRIVQTPFDRQAKEVRRDELRGNSSRPEHPRSQSIHSHYSGKIRMSSPRLKSPGRAGNWTDLTFYERGSHEHRTAKRPGRSGDSSDSADSSAPTKRGRCARACW